MSGPVDGFDHSNGGATDIVQVEDGRVGIQASGMEGVAILHGQTSETLKVFFADRLFHGGDAAGDDVGGASGEEVGCGGGSLHARRRTDALLLG